MSAEAAAEYGLGYDLVAGANIAGFKEGRRGYDGAGLLLSRTPDMTNQKELPSGGSFSLIQEAGADDSVRPVRSLHPVGRGRVSRRLFLSFRASDRVTGVGIRLFGLGRTDCRVASLLAMTDFVGADDSVRPVKALHPVGRDPCVPPPRPPAARTPPPSFRASDRVTGVGIRSPRTWRGSPLNANTTKYFAYKNNS